MQGEEQVFPEEGQYLVACIDHSGRWLSDFFKKSFMKEFFFFQPFLLIPPTSYFIASIEVGFEK